MDGTIDIEDRIRMTMDANNMAWWEMELPSGAVFFHENKAHMFGGKPSEFVHYSSFTDRLSKKDYSAAMKAMEGNLSGKTSHYSTVYKLKDAHGKRRTLFDKGRVVYRGKDGTIKIMGIIIDITDDISLIGSA